MSTEEFIEWLQQELKARGWDMAELARRGGITRSQISKLMSGERNPGPNTCIAIARAFRIPAEEVFRRAGVLPKSRKGTEGSEELLFHYQHMDAEARRYLLKIARVFDETGHMECPPSPPK